MEVRPGEVFDALKQTYAGRQLRQGSDPRRLRADGFLDGWEVEIDEKATAFIIGAPPASLMELVAWVRAYVPDEVALEIYDDQLTFGPTSLRPGITPEQVRAEYFPDAWKIEQTPGPSRRRWRSGCARIRRPTWRNSWAGRSRRSLSADPPTLMT